MDLNEIIYRNVTIALTEDYGAGDLSAMLVPAEQTACALVITREDAILCGSAWFDECFKRLDPATVIEWQAQEGMNIYAGQLICTLSGNARALLSAERAAINFLQTLSATATTTQRYVAATAGCKAVIMDTRKTLPGLRHAQKYAVAIGGGKNQRLGLYDGVLIKENHVAAAGGIAPALEHARRIAADYPVQIEVEDLNQLQQALAAEATLILLDNFSLKSLREAVRITAGRAELEASGGITLENIRAIAQTGVDRISIGSLTKDIEAIDFSMRFMD